MLKMDKEVIFITTIKKKKSNLKQKTLYVNIKQNLS